MFLVQLPQTFSMKDNKMLKKYLRLIFLLLPCNTSQAASCKDESLFPYPVTKEQDKDVYIVDCRALVSSVEPLKQSVTQVQQDQIPKEFLNIIEDHKGRVANIRKLYYELHPLTIWDDTKKGSSKKQENDLRKYGANARNILNAKIRFVFQSNQADDLADVTSISVTPYISSMRSISETSDVDQNAAERDDSWDKRNFINGRQCEPDKNEDENVRKNIEELKKKEYLCSMADVSSDETGYISDYIEFLKKTLQIPQSDTNNDFQNVGKSPRVDDDGKSDVIGPDLQGPTFDTASDATRASGRTRQDSEISDFSDSKYSNLGDGASSLLAGSRPPSGQSRRQKNDDALSRVSARDTYDFDSDNDPVGADNNNVDHYSTTYCHTESVVLYDLFRTLETEKKKLSCLSQLKECIVHMASVRDMCSLCEKRLPHFVNALGDLMIEKGVKLAQDFKFTFYVSGFKELDPGYNEDCEPANTVLKYSYQLWRIKLKETEN